jgi:hypothetical protein
MIGTAMINRAQFDQRWKENDNELGANKDVFVLFICTMLYIAGNITFEIN